MFFRKLFQSRLSRKTMPEEPAVSPTVAVPLDLVSYERFPAFTPSPISTFALRQGGFGMIERGEGSRWRWGLGPRSKAIFALLREQEAILKLVFNSPFPGQTVAVEHNGTVIADFRDLAPGQEVTAEIRLEACAGINTIRFIYAAWNGNPGLFPNDPRAVAVMFTTLSLNGTDGRPLPFPCNETRFPFIGRPLENEALARREYAEGKTVLSALPPVITVSLTTHCNAKVPCVICDINTRPKGADMEMAESIIAQAEPLLRTARYVLLHCGGEAMLSKQFDPMIDFICPPTRVSFATNAMLMTEARTERMLKKDIMGAFVVSLDAATAETYRVMRPSFDFERVKRNVSYYTRRAKELGRTESKIFLNMTVCERNLNDVPRLVDLALELGAVQVQYNHLNAGLDHVVPTADGEIWDYVEQATFKDEERHDLLMEETYWKAKTAGIQMVVTGKAFIGPHSDRRHNIVREMEVVPFSAEDEDGWHSPFHPRLASGVASCFKPWQETVIQPNGIVRLCWRHDETAINLGDLKQDDFLQIWNGADVIQDRQQFLSKSVAGKCYTSSSCPFCGKRGH